MSTQKVSTDDSSSIRIILLLPLSLFFIFAIENNDSSNSEELVEKEMAILSSYEEVDDDYFSEDNNLQITALTVKSNPVYHKSQVMGSQEIREENGEELIEGEKLIEEVVVKEVFLVEMTGYSSTPDQTNCQPFITASGEWVRDGIVATNFLEFGTKIRIPEYFGDKEFVVKDRMNSRYTLPKNDSYDGYVDIWFQTRNEAVNFGRVLAEIEVIE
ncbi:MAG: 3D domain-containing protein [Candidatus Pacebacteria bacterium]|nr:3D domain-containing protein [Candidatus Paceibacterota bacterium]